DVKMRYTAVRTRVVEGVARRAVLIVWRISADIEPLRSKVLRLSSSPSGLPASESYGARLIDVPTGRFGNATGIVENTRRLMKLSRLRELRDEKMANSGPTAFSPATLALGGK